MILSQTCATRKCVIDNILQQIAQLSDLEKFLLYLKLPMGRSPEPDPLKQPLNPLGSRSEVQLTITWIKAHLEEDLDVSLFKEDVYREYLQYSGNYQIKHLSKADFGKVMKQVFPKVKARRLGHRGDSRYTYSGLTNKFSVERPILPDLSDNCSNEDRTAKQMTGLNATTDQEQEKAAVTIILEWAEKMCNVKCSSVTELALQLLNKSCVDISSVSARTLISDQRLSDLPVGKHQLHRKLQEREQIREQKRKLQQEVSIDSNRNNTPERQKSRRRSGQGKVNSLEDSVSRKNVKNPQPTQLKLSVNNNLEGFVSSNDDNIDRMLGVSPVIKKEVFELQNDNRNKEIGSSIVGGPIITEAGKHYKNSSLIGANNLEMKVVSNIDRNGWYRKLDVANGNACTDNGTKICSRVEDLRQFDGDLQVITDKKNSNKLSSNEREEFISPPIIGTEDKIIQLRKILTEGKVGLPSSQISTAITNDPSVEYDHQLTSPCFGRKVSFQSPDSFNATMLGPVTQDSNLMQNRIQNIPPLTYASPDSIISQVVSHASSANASPFMSPSTTPLLRSRHNSGQTSSTYVTPRSTPFTPDIMGQSETGTPFMSPVPTPLFSRSRHNSSQNIRAPFTPTSKSRHSSGTASYRHTPYQDEFSRRKSRNLSGNMPLSAPLSPRVQDNPFNQLNDLNCHSNADTIESVFTKRSMVNIISGMSDRTRHVSAGPTIHYQPQPSPSTFSNCSNNSDSLSLEVSNAMCNPQSCQETLSQVSSVNRPQSVPPLQMNTCIVPDTSFIPKSYPTTPIFNQQFDFTREMSQSGSFVSKPVQSDFSDFPNGSLDFVEENIDPTSANNLGGINPSISSLNNTNDLTQSLSETFSTNNISFTENFQPENTNAFSQEENVSSIFLQNVEGATFTSNPLVANDLRVCPNQSSNRSNNSECQQIPLQGEDMVFSGNSHITLNALNTSSNDLPSLERGFEHASDDYIQPYSALEDQDDFALFGMSRE